MISFKQLFYESVEDELTQAIRNRNVIYFFYEGDEKLGKGWRWVEPVAYGISKAGNGVIRAWQLREDPSVSKIGKGWRLFRTDKIKRLSISLRKFNRPRKGYNPTGDRSMGKMIVNAKFK